MLRNSWARCALGALALSACVTQAQIVDQDFDSVTGTGGGAVLIGSGFNSVTNWDDGIDDERAFGGTVGNFVVNAINARGVTTGGVGGSGAGLVEITGGTFDILNLMFGGVTGAGGGVFLAGDPNAADTFGFTAGWDTGVAGEGAFGGTFGGATLLGSMSAQGVVGGGMGGDGAGQLDVDNVDTTTGNWFAGLQFQTGPFPGANPLLNPGFDAGGGSLNSWTPFGNAFAVNDTSTPALTGTHVLKMFGTFTGGFGVSGVSQDLNASAGQEWTLDCFSAHDFDDSITGSMNSLVMKIEFYDAGAALLAETEATILDANSPTATWIDNAPITAIAPAGTTTARAVLLFLQPDGVAGGAGLIDGVTFEATSGGGLDPNAFSLTAKFQGVANSAGESLGDVQLRIEDPDGDRLIFSATANGSFQTIGGSLDTGVEAEPNGRATPGVFDYNAALYVVVLAFDNDGANPWGAGGTLNLDEVVLGNSNPENSGWFAGLTFENLALSEGDANSLALRGDILGSVPGGEYELRLEAFRITSNGLDDDFNSVTGVGGGLFLEPNMGAFGSTGNFDDGIGGEGAFAGTFGNAQVFGNGVSARGLPTGGPTGDGSVEIRVNSIISGPGGGWFAGMSWGGQGLASTDLNDVVLTADIRGTGDSNGIGPLGNYELRIEDAQGDRRFFAMTANGAWQSVGGALSSATEAGALGGGGDGVFNLDSPFYNVAISFIDPETTWSTGGTLEVDNLFLTPVANSVEIGRTTFSGVANGAFQSVGGLLSEADSSSFGNYDEDFSGATGVSGGFEDWDTGIVGESAFFGTFGAATVDPNGGATTGACLTCGVSGGPAAQIRVEGVTNNGGGWFAGMVFNNVPADLSGDLNDIFLTADIRGSIDPNSGQSLGTYLFRIEDADLTTRQFTLNATGGFQAVGGALGSAPVVQINAGDGIFDRNQATYTITVAYVGQASDWGSGGTLTIDNLHLDGIRLIDADFVNIALAFRNEITTWDVNGSLTLDNLFLGVEASCFGDVNNDGNRDLSDLAGLLASFGTVSGDPGYDPNADFDNNGAIELADLAGLLSVFGTPCP